MKLVPAKLGATPKQLSILGGLVVLGLISYFLNRTPSGPTVTPQRSTPVAQVPSIQKMPLVARRAANRGGTGRAEDFKPSLKLPEGMDVSKIDPTIKLALLEKVRNVPMELGTRGSVFAFGQPPPPPAPPPGPKTTVTPGAMTSANKQQEPLKPIEPAKPTAPPIPLKFYGYSNTQRGGTKRAFFLETNGDDIDVASENDVIKNRYKVIRVGVNSVVVEDLNFKSQQTLPLVEELAG